MSKLSNWLPFKFKRNKKKDDKRDEASSSVPVRAQREDPVRAMSRMLDTMRPDRFWRSPLAMFDEMGRFFGDFAPHSFQPSVDVVDEGKHLRVTAELPGLDRDDVELSVEDDLLILHGEKKTEEEFEEDGCYRVERFFGRFHRAIPLPSDVDPDGAEAKFDKGVLTVRFPKTSEASSSRRIRVS